MIRAFPALRRPLRQSLGATAGVTIPPDRSALRPISHGFDAIPVSLILIRPLLGHDGLTDWYIQIAASLVALAAPFFSKRVRRIMVRLSVGRGLFPAGFGSLGQYSTAEPPVRRFIASDVVGTSSGCGMCKAKGLAWACQDALMS